MKAKDLHKLWGAPDNTQLTAKQHSFRLPVHVAAKLNALSELFPNKTKTELVGDLLATAIEELAQSLPLSAGAKEGVDPDRGDYFKAEGVAAQFRQLANSQYLTYQKELGNKNSQPLYPDNLVVFADDLEQ
jgi:predicted DNA-binding protein